VMMSVGAISRLSNTFVGVGALRATPPYCNAQLRHAPPADKSQKSIKSF
jgi:hypothetical protein